jgi:hypothetical protein
LLEPSSGSIDGSQVGEDADHIDIDNDGGQPVRPISHAHVDSFPACGLHARRRSALRWPPNSGSSVVSVGGV